MTWAADIAVFKFVLFLFYLSVCLFESIDTSSLLPSHDFDVGWDPFNEVYMN